MEQWKQVPGHEGIEASTEGRIRNRSTGCVLKPWLRAGYLTVRASGRPTRQLRSVHTLVAETFIGPRPSPGRFHCAHLDGDKTNNKPSNLAWVTPSENEQHKRAHGTYSRGQHAKTRLFTEEQAITIREIVSAGVSQSRVADLLGVAISTVNNIVRGQFYR